MRITPEKFISEMEQDIFQMLHKAKTHRELGLDVLKAKPRENAWSALECFEHLNRYSSFYLDAFEKKIRKAVQPKRFSPGWLGKKSADSMLPKEGEIKNKMKTFKSKNPSVDGHVDKDAVNQFIEDQERLLKMMEGLKKADLNVRVSTTLLLLKFKMGDALAFYINHELRHMVQIENTLTKVSQSVA